MREKISVCMATYNGADKIKIQLESIFQQLSDGDEVIIVDDCSKDKTIEVIQAYHHPQVHIFRHDKNQGYVKSFEDAIAFATHDVIFLSDQDDKWDQHKIEKIISFFEGTRVGVVIHNAEVVDSKGMQIKKRLFTYGMGKNFVTRHMIGGHNFGCCMTFRRSLLKWLLPFPCFVESHDQWIAINADMNGCEVSYLDENLIKWIRYGNNATDYESIKRKIGDKVLTRIKIVILALICIYRRIKRS